jgi:hypothetical protein
MTNSKDSNAVVVGTVVGFGGEGSSKDGITSSGAHILFSLPPLFLRGGQQQGRRHHQMWALAFFIFSPPPLPPYLGMRTCSNVPSVSSPSHSPFLLPLLFLLLPLLFRSTIMPSMLSE